VVFQLVTAPHPHFTRRGYDLVYTAKIPLVASLCGDMLTIPTLDARTLSIPITDIVKTGSVQVVKGEGMAKPDGTVGDLLIVYDLIFPTFLNDEQKMLLSAAVFLPPKLSTEQSSAVKRFEKAYMDTLKGWFSGFKL
jgi:DnaJ-class molecular chaperone